jgi:hypothetical protein
MSLHRQNPEEQQQHHPYDRENLKSQLKIEGGVSLTKIVEEFGIAKQSVSAIK